MEKTQAKNTAVSYSNFGAGKPVVPFSASQQTNSEKSLDPSSCLRADRCPIPNLFDHRSSSRERSVIA